MAKDKSTVSTNNFGLSGYIDLPSAKSLPDGELLISQQVHQSLSRTSLSFQAFKNLGFSFRYSGHGVGGREAYGRINHDRSFDAHLNLWKEKKYLPSISIGLRDFIGTGWYSSEYIVATKNFGNLNISTGLGFGRLVGKSQLKNPFSGFSDRFTNREISSVGVGGSISAPNWFQGQTSIFGGLRFRLGKNLSLSAEYNPDLMTVESRYLKLNNNWNYGLDYKLNDFFSLSAQQLHGSTFSVTAKVNANPKKPPFGPGLELAPVPMRNKELVNSQSANTDWEIISKVLEVDNFEILQTTENGAHIRIDLINRKFRSTSQALGRVSSTLQRFSDKKIQTAEIVFHNKDFQIVSYLVNLQQIQDEQFSPLQFNPLKPSIQIQNNTQVNYFEKADSSLNWGVGPYITHRLFNPDLPLSAELGAELAFELGLVSKISLEGSLRKSILTNLKDNKRRSNSGLPRVHSDWPLYDLAGQNGHINDLAIVYSDSITPKIFARAHFGLLEPFFAGIGGEILFKPPSSKIAFGMDIHHVKKRDYSMQFNLRDYKTTVGHLSMYLDAGKDFEIEMNVGRYLAGDWGLTTRISRKFGTGWEVGGYATLTEVPFDEFGEGSFDKGIYVTIPLDWITGYPQKSKRSLVIRPITRDGGAHLASARSLYRQVKESHMSQFVREQGRLWK